MISDLVSEWSPHLRAIWNDPFTWMREHWTFLLLVLASLIAVGWWLMGLVTVDDGRFCPGPAPARSFLGWRNIVAKLWPINWVSYWHSLAQCGYDLSQTPTDNTQCQICPECGHRSGRSQQIPAALTLSLSKRRHWLPAIGLQSTNRPRIFRRDVVAGLVLLGCLTLWRSPTYRYASYLESAPDRFIILAAHILGPASPDHLEDLLRRRIMDPGLAAADAELAIPGLLQRLRSDSRSWNGWYASDALQHLLKSSDLTIATTATRSLETALTDPNRQARQLAAAVMRRHLSQPNADPPSAALLAVTVEGLDGDELDERSGWVANAREGVEFLIRHAPRAKPFLQQKLGDPDAQGRWLAAVIVARANLTELMTDAAPILIEQLRDNDTSGDERVAADALRHFGPAIIPALTPHFESSDAQLRTWCGRLVRELRESQQGVTPAPILPRAEMLIYRPGAALLASEDSATEVTDMESRHQAQQPAANAATKSR